MDIVWGEAGFGRFLTAPAWRALTAVIAVVAVMVATTVLSLAPTGAGPRSLARATNSTHARLASAPIALRAAASGVTGRTDSAFAVRRTGDTLVASGGGIITRFTRRGAVLRTRGGTVVLRLDAAPAAAAVGRGSTASYIRPRVTEWYRNGPLGLEQGFTLARPTASDSATIGISVGGSLRATRAGTGANFVNRDGDTVLRYGALGVRDARGRRLPASLTVAPGRLVVRFRTAGARFPVTVDPFIEQAAFTPDPSTGADGFGTSVALSADGRTALIGAQSSLTATSQQGQAWVYTLTADGTWSRQGPPLVPINEVGNGRFGASVALSADGNTAIIGAPQDNAGVGAAWVFTRTGTAWSQGAKITSTQPGQLQFGQGVAISADGRTTLIGAPQAGSGVGGALVFTGSGSTWTRQGSMLTPDDESGQALAGFSVALSADGMTALLGGPADNRNRGAAWVFTLGGSSWFQQAPKLKANDESGTATFGNSAALSADGNTALIGGPGNGTPTSQTGAGWVFTRSASTWTQQGPGLIPDDVADGRATAGQGVALTADGHTAILGGPSDAGVQGAFWIFSWNGSALAQQGLKRVTSGYNPQAGGSVAVAGLSPCATTVLIGGNDYTYYGPRGYGWIFQSSTCSYPNVVGSTAGLAGYWRLGETSGTTAADEMDAHSGTYSGGYTLGSASALSGDSDPSATFDGSTGQVRLPPLGNTSNWTIEGWTNLASNKTNAQNALFAGHNGPRLLIRPSGFYADDDTLGAAAGKFTGATSSNTGRWVYWALVRNGSTLTLYRNAVVVGTSSLVGAGPSTLNGSIGSENNNAYPLRGSIDEVAVYNAALSPSSLLLHYDVGVNTFAGQPYRQRVAATGGLLDYWRLGETSGPTAADQTGAHSGTFSGGFTVGAPGAIQRDPDTATSFDGQTGSVKLPLLGSYSNWTLEGWTNLAAGASGYGALYAGYGGPRVMVSTSGFYADDDTNGTATGKISGKTLPNVGQWVYWALVRSGDTLTVYRNGVQVATSTLGGESASNLKGSLGAEDNGTYPLRGGVDEAAVYTTGLSAATIAAHYNAAFGY